MGNVPEYGFVLAAGKGTRLKPYTDLVPKPLVEAGGKSLIGHALDALAAAGVTNVTVNLHYMADLLATHLQSRDRPALTLSYEETLLDTGGGIKNALATLGSAPFYVVSGDSLWTDGPGSPALNRLAKHWDPERMDILLLLQPLAKMQLTSGTGDYDLAADGRAVRAPDKSGAYVWTSIRICKPEIFANAPAGAFSFLTLLDQAQQRGRLYGLVHDGEWHHISTAADLENVRAALGSAALCS